MQNEKFTIVIGASADGISAIIKLLDGWSKFDNASIFIVLHLSQKSNAQNIIDSFQRHTALICQVATHELSIKSGHLYLAPVDYHLIIKEDLMLITKGTHENKYRPSIDVLFRSAAVSHSHRVIGIILTGLLEDGASGMFAIKKTGGICIVQDPDEAMYPDMPRSVMSVIDVDYKTRVNEAGKLLEKLLHKPLSPEIPVPTEIQVEAILTETMMTGIDQLKIIADRSDFVCPDCGGGLWAIKKDPAHRYRCHNGHTYTENVLFNLQTEHLEQSVWVSIRMLEEQRNLMLLMTKHAREQDDNKLEFTNISRVKEIDLNIGRMKTILTAITNYNLQ